MKAKLSLSFVFGLMGSCFSARIKAESPLHIGMNLCVSNLEFCFSMHFFGWVFLQQTQFVIMLYSTCLALFD